MSLNGYASFRVLGTLKQARCFLSNAKCDFFQDAIAWGGHLS